MGQSPRNGVFYRVVDMVPADVKTARHFFPAHPPGPASEKPLVLRRQMILACRPRNPFGFHTALTAVYPAASVNQNDGDHPEGDEVKTPNRQRVVARGGLVAARAERLAVAAGAHGDFDDGWFLIGKLCRSDGRR